MRVIVGKSGIKLTVSDVVASGMVNSGYATYVDEVEKDTDTAAVDVDPPQDEADSGPEPEPETDETGDDGVKSDPESETVPGGFDPSSHKVSEVLDYLETADAEEVARVLALEENDKGRSSILGWEAQ